MGFSKLGSEIFVNTTTAGEQYGSAITQLTNGDIVVAWTDVNGSAVNVRGQILNSDGLTKDGSEFMLNTTLTGSQSDVALTALGNGGFAAAWTSYAAMPAGADLPWELENDAFQTHAVSQVFTSSGAKSGGESTHFLSSSDYPVDFYIDPPGLVSAGPAYLDSHEQFHPALTADLSSGGAEFTLAVVEELHLEDTYFLSPIPPIPSFVEMGMNNIALFDSSPSFLVEHEANVTWDLAFSSVLAPNLQVTDNLANPAMITLGNGDIVTAYERHHWESTSSAAWLEKEIKVDFGNGANPATVGSDYSENPALGELEDGNIIVVWEDGDLFSGDPDNVVGQLFTPGGTRIGGEFTIDSSSGDASNPSVAALADGRFVVVWQDASGDGSGTALKAQIFTADAVKSGEEFLVNSVTDDNQVDPRVIGLDNGNFIVTWTSADGATDDIKSQVFDPQVYAGDGTSATVYGGSLGDHLTDGIGTDDFYGEDGNDTVVVTSRIGADSFDGGGGIDTIDWSASAESGATFRLFLGTATNDVGIDETMTGFENLTGTANADTVYGTSGGNTLSGGGGGDTLIGARGDDWLEGDGGNDTLRGDDGIDYLFGGTGADTMQGGLGGDTYFVDSAGDVVSDTFDLSAGFDYVSSSITYTIGPYIERLGLDGDDDIDGTGNLLNNHLFGNSGANTLSGLFGIDDINGFEGADRLDGGRGSDELDGGADNDTLAGGIGDDTLDGGSEEDWADYAAAVNAVTVDLSLADAQDTGEGFDKLISIEHVVGSAFDDTLLGDSGDNEFIGGVGADTIAGLLGADIFVYESASDTGFTAPNRDVIEDFEHLVDQIDVDALDAQTGSNGIQDFDFIGTDEFSAEGQIRVFQNGADTDVRFNATGIDSYETAITLKNTIAADITVDDFLL